MPTSEQDYKAHFRMRHGISLCRVCLDCEMIFHPRGAQTYCDECRSVRKQISNAKYFLERQLFALGAQDGVDALKGVRKEMMDEEGEIFAEQVMGKVCRTFRERKAKDELPL